MAPAPIFFCIERVIHTPKPMMMTSGRMAVRRGDGVEGGDFGELDVGVQQALNQVGVVDERGLKDLFLLAAVLPV